MDLIINLMRGFIAPPLVIILVIATTIGIGWYTFSTRQQAKVEISPNTSPTISPTPSPSSTPTLTPKPTVKPTLKPTAKPSPTPSPSPSNTPTPAPEAPKTGCAEYNPGGDLGSLKVTIQPEAGKSLVGDAGVKIYRKYEGCKGVDPGFPLIQIIRQGSTDTTFSGMRPGPFKIDVNYHGKTSTHDVGINSGENSISITVSD